MGIISTKLSVNTTLGAGANIPVGTVIHKNCNKMSASGNTWTVKGSGYYKVTAFVTVAPTTAGDASITLLDNGSAVATASGVVATAGDNITLPVQYVGLNECACSAHSLTMTTATAGTIVESDVVIERGDL